MESPGEITVETALRLLANKHCRATIRYLEQMSDGVASYDELAECIQTHCPGVQDKEEGMIKLHHGILPRLEDAGLVEHDRRGETVRHHSHPLMEDILNIIDEWES